VAPEAVGALRAAGSGEAGRGRLRGAFAVVTLVTGAGLLIFADPAWTHALGALALVACAVTVFTLTASPPESAESPGSSRN